MSSVPACQQAGDDGFTGFSNSLGQSPCFIASALANVCMGGSFVLPSLNGSQPTYPSPSGSNANSCTCSSVYYYLLSACSGCQTSRFTSWDDYSRNCNNATITLGSFPKPIPPGTAVPHYAYLEVESGGFNYSSALNAGGAESFPISSILSATSTVSFGRSNTSAITDSESRKTLGSSTGSATQPTPTPTNTTSIDKGRSTTGIMIAGIVGGVVFLMLLVCGLRYIVKSRRKGAISVQKLPSELSLIGMEKYSLRIADQASELSADRYSLLGTPTRPEPLELPLEDDEYLVDTRR